MDTESKAFDLNMFELQWEALSEEEKVDFLEQSLELDPQQAIVPVLAGINSYHFNVRNAARKGLGQIRDSVRVLIEDTEDRSSRLSGMKASHSICTRIYRMIKPGMAFSEQSYFFKTLLSFEGKGAWFAFMAVYRKLITPSAMEKIILTLSEDHRLQFVDQYLQAGPAVRLKLGFSFIRILNSIQTREPVIRLYASLFDRGRDADPFLNNIDQTLRSPERILQKELVSPSPTVKILGLKALSMIRSRLSPDLLAELLTAQEVRKVRIAVYNVIENSSMGTYPELFDTILELFHAGDKKEAFQAFKALAVTGKVPIHELLETVRKIYPDLMPLIHMEISTLSKMAFFVLQDIALNKKKYLGSNFMTNLACVFGMIKKRPERVVRLLKKYDADSKDSVRIDVTRFIEKTKLLLEKEKEDIETRFDKVVRMAEKSAREDTGLMKKLFSTSSEKKIEQIKTGKHPETVSFEGNTIVGADLASGGFNAPMVYFSKSIFNNCDLSGSTFLNTCFKKSILFNVVLGKAEFDGACFDNAVFINVDAREAVFKNCSFQNAGFYNCNFNLAQITDASFFNTVISKTSFNQSNLSFSSFAFSKISAVSFVTATMNQTDFRGVNARFCRFPTSIKNSVQAENINYNARVFQLSFKEMPRMDKAVVSDINMLMFCEFIHYGERKFLKQNRLSQLTAFDIFKPKQADLFQIIPFLLHENVAFPGMDPVSSRTPCGICDYIPDLETQTVLNTYARSSAPAARRHNEFAIEGLFTIGSVGSLAQTADSDIDYWVCIDEEKINRKKVGLLRKKLEAMERMVADQFDLQVTFFLVDIHNARDNDFGDSTLESSGSAQARLLKEEFYRTMIYVAGKIPLWAVLPTPISLNYYNSILENVGAVPGLNRYIDLGDIHAIPSSEYYGASIWQMFKWLKSPFKSVIKMTLLENYIYGYGRTALLCNHYKDEWMNSGAQMRLAQNDSYFILLESLLRYYRSAGDEQSVTILLTCFFLKLEISKDAQIDNTVFGLRKILLEKCMDKWGWKKEDVFRIGSFKNWRYNEIQRLSISIEKYMVKKYKTVNKAFEHLFQGRSQISPEDRTVLGRKIYIEFSKQPGKVDKVLLVSRSDRHFHGLHLKYIPEESGIGTWALVNRQAAKAHQKEELLIHARTIEEIGAWLINNGLYNEHAVINLVPNPTYVTFDDIRKLYKTMYEFLGPIHKSLIGFDQLLMASRPVCLFISVNFYAPKQQGRVTEYTAIYLNSWGEMYCKSFYSKKGFASMEETKQDILKRIGIEKFPLNTAFYFSKGTGR